MGKKTNAEKKFISYGSLKQDDVDKIVRYLKDCGMSDDDIGKAGDYKGWFHLNPNYKIEIEIDYKGKGKK